MIPSEFIPVSEWLPDQPTNEVGSQHLINAVPQASTYRAVNSNLANTDALDGRALRGVSAIDSSGAVNNFAGDAGKLYKLTGSTWNDVSKAGGYGVESWEFAKFGDRIIAASKDSELQYYDMGASALFADMAGSPPKADHIAVVRDFVVLANLDDGGTQYPDRVQWSGFNNAEIWGVDAAAQSDFQDLFGNGGAIQRIVPGEYGVIFQENSIWRMDYAGPPTIFRFDEVERGRGTPAKNSVCWQGEQVYYWGGDGFYAFNGASSTPIGAEKVDRHVKGRIDTSRYDEMVGAVDRRNRLVIWSIPLISGGSELVVFSWPTGKWGQADIELEAINEFADSGYNLDQLDALLGNIDDNSINVDSPDYKGGSLNLAAFSTDHRLGLFTGAALTAEIDTKETSSPVGGRLFIDTVRPLFTGNDADISIVTRDNANGDPVISSTRTVNAIGEAQFHNDVRFVRFRMILAGGFDHAQGVRAYYKPTGRR